MNKLIIVTICLLSQLHAFDNLLQLSSEAEKIKRIPKYWDQYYSDRARNYLEAYTVSHEKLADIKLILLKVKAAMHVKLGPKFDYFEELIKQEKFLPQLDDPEYVYELAYYAARNGGTLDQRVRQIEILQTRFTPTNLHNLLSQNIIGNELLILSHIASIKELLRYARELHDVLTTLQEWSELNFGIAPIIKGLGQGDFFTLSRYKITGYSLLDHYLELSSIYGMSRLLNVPEN